MAFWKIILHDDNECKEAVTNNTDDIAIVPVDEMKEIV